MGRPGGVNPCDVRFMVIAASYGSIFVAVIFTLIALVTNYWKEIWDGNVHNDRVEVHFGLHRVCFSSGDHCRNSGSSYDRQNYLPSVHGCVNTAGFLAVLASLVTLIHMAFDRFGKTKLYIMIPAVTLPILAGVFTLVGCVLFSKKVEIEDEYISFYREIELGWSFALESSVCGLLFIGGILNGLSCIMRPTPKFV